MDPRRIRVLYVEDSYDLVLSYRMMLSRDERFEDAGARSSADGIVEEVQRARADIVLMDLTMPGLSPLAAVRMLAEQVPSARVIGYSGHDDEATREAVRRAGAWAFVAKLGDPFDVLAEIHRVASLPEKTRPALL